MIKRPMLVIACVFLLGTCCGESFHWCYMAAVIWLYLYLFRHYGKNHQWKGLFLWFGILSAVFLAAVGHMKYSISFREQYVTQISDGEFLTIQGEISKKQFKKEQYYCELSCCYIVQSGTMIPCNHVIVPFTADEYPIQKILIVKGKVNTFNRGKNEGSFDEQSFYRSQKVDFMLQEPQVIAAYGEGCGFLEKLFQWKLYFQRILFQITEEKTAGVLAGMLLGDKSFLDQETKNLYRQGGISHVLAISALHISIFAGGIYQFMRKRKLGFHISAFGAGFFVISYAYLTGGSVSVQRAAAMFCLFIGAAAVKRSYDMLNGLGCTVLFLLWDNPFLIHYPGFVFSLAAVLGIGITVRILTEEEADSMWDRWKKSFSGGIGIQITTLPIVVYYYYEVPVYTVLLNLAIIPLLAPILISGAMGMLAGGVCLSIGKVLVFPASVGLQCYEILCRWSVKWPGAQKITGQPQIWEMTVYYLCLGGLLYFRYRWKRGQENLPEPEENNTVSKPKQRFPAIYFGFLVLALVFCRSREPGMEVDYLDVGQGDGIFISAGDGNCFFIDGGSSSESMVGTYRILPFLKAKGVEHIDYWLVSHGDTDHISGLLEVLESGYPVDCLVFSKYMPRDEAWERLKGYADAAGVQILYFGAGDALQMQNVQIRCLYPFSGSEISGIPETDVDRNERSMVLLLDLRGNSFLFSGDISEKQEQELMQIYPNLEADIYKAAHHGSKYSNSGEFLQQLSPRYAIVSCGLHNSYGHPGAEAVSHMEEAGAGVYYTMEQGQIKVRIGKGGELQISCFCQ